VPLAGAGSACWFGTESSGELPKVTPVERGTGETVGAFNPSCRPVMVATLMTVIDSARWSKAHP